jgi:hypothetical protein
MAATIWFHLAFWASNVYVFLWHLLHPDAKLLDGSGKFGWFFRVGARHPSTLVPRLC